MKYLTVDSDNKILAWNEDSSFEGCIKTDSGIPVYDTNTQSLYWEGSTIVAKDDAESIARNNERISTQYKRKREAEYPSIADQLDEIYHNGINSWKAVIKVTKDKYPKG